jgi:diguanylate cyclase (GGDEF)-like protein
VSSTRAVAPAWAGGAGAAEDAPTQPAQQEQQAPGAAAAAAPPWWRASRWRLASRMVLSSLVLLLLLQAISLTVIHESIESNARGQLAERLVVGERIWQRLLDQRSAKLTQGAALLAADYGFRSAVSSDDRETIVSALENHGARIGAVLVALLQPDFSVRATTPDAGESLLPALAQAAPRMASGANGSHMALVAGRPVQFVMVPMRTPLPVGFVVMGFELDRNLVDELRAVSGLHATLVIDYAAAPDKVLHSTLGSAVAAQAVWPDGSSARGELALDDGVAHLLHAVELGSAGAERARLWLAGSVREAVAPYTSLQWALLALTAAGVIVFGFANHVMARRVTRPLRSLVSASNRLGRGDYHTPVRQTGRSDEVGDLAKAFEGMRGNIAASEREIRQLAYWDRLTGLPNRAQFRERVQQALAQSQAQGQTHPDSGRGIAVVMLDLDRFKHVNDVLGYACGDRLLKSVGERLRQVVAAGDLPARLGGDEFAVLMCEADATRAGELAQRIAAVFETPLTLDDQTVDLSAGIGIACAPAHAGEADALLSRAEVAMYAAKRSTAGARVYDPSLDSASAQTLSLLSELKRAIEQGELRLYLQPKMALDTRRVIGAEALVRWQHPTRGIVPPLDFIPFAEQTGFVRRLTLWIFGEVAARQRRLAELGVARTSVNLSTRDLLDTELPEKLDELLQRHGARADAFCLEITESAIMDDPARAEQTLNRLAERGYKLSIDDFGTGYSSLAYLQRLPVNELKIDKSFVMAMERAEGDQKIVRSTIDLAHNLGLSVVAEGVENEATLTRLAELGCDEAQGYHLSRPLPCEAFLLWAEKALPPQGASPQHGTPPELGAVAAAGAVAPRIEAGAELRPVV